MIDCNKNKNYESSVICICGLSGSGKSTQAKIIAKKYRLKNYSGGDALKALAIEKGYKPQEHGWWESNEGLRFLKMRSQDLKFDNLIDNKLLEIAKKGNVILDSWTMPWLLETGFKIWLGASFQKRAERIAKRDSISVDEAFIALKSKEGKTKSIYKKLYGFKLGEDFTPFDMILDTEHLNIEDVTQVLCMVLENIVFCCDKK
jgi:cytidylate kinase